MNHNMWEFIIIVGMMLVGFYLVTLTYDLLKLIFIYVYKEFYKYYTWGSNRRFWEMIHKITSNKEFMAQLREDAKFRVVFARAKEPIYKGELVTWNKLMLSPWNHVDVSPYAQYKYINVKVD